jgi:UDP-galactopyranose mutase
MQTTPNSPAISRRETGTTTARGDGRPLLLCLSHLRWDFVFQRPQHLLTRAAQSFRVVFVEEPVFVDVPSPTLVLSPRDGGITVAVPHLPPGHSPTEVMRLQRELMSELVEAEGKPQVLWYYSPMALSFSAHIDAPVCLYDCMDELSAFRGAAPDLTLWERRLFAKADFVLAGGRTLYQAKRRQHQSVTLLPSSIDTAHFDTARTKPEDPADQRDIAHPRLGFFGVIDERFDTALLGEAAALRPDLSFIMIGPVVKIDPASLPKAPNIHWLGSKSYAELPRYLGNWDVGIMPFAINESTRFISPTKTPEFLAAGLPVVSTPITDVVSPYGDAGVVDIASDAESFVTSAAALLERPRDGWLAKVDAMLASNSWDKSWQRVDGLIRNTLMLKAAPAAQVVGKANPLQALPARAAAPAATSGGGFGVALSTAPRPSAGDARLRSQAVSAAGKE